MDQFFTVQTHSETASLFEVLKTLFSRPGLQRVRIASAYARWDGLGLISNDIEKLVKRGGEFASIYGAGNGITTPDSLLYGLYLKELYPSKVIALLVEDAFSNSIFHPKLFEFRYSSFSIAVVGSGNLTGGGLVRNTELAVQVWVPTGDVLEKSLNVAWEKLAKLGLPVTAERVRALMKGPNAGLESDQFEGLPKGAGKPYLKTGPKTAPKPLFEKVLDLKSAAKKSKILAKLDALSEEPTRLYLQIFDTETGGSAGNAGYQVQLPVATLATYFGVGETQTKRAEFRLKGETVGTNLRARLRRIPKAALV